MDKFILVKDAATIQKLRDKGFVQIPSNSSMVVFLNNPSLFSEDDKDLKLKYTNILCM